MGRGSSGAGKGGGAGVKAGGGTPSGVTLDQFRQMDEQQQIATIDNILSSATITVPQYLDGSDTTKVMYALGMSNKTTVVDEKTLNAMQGRELFRTVYEDGSMPPPSSNDILDQVRNGDYTQLSGSGGSAHGRAIYFATSFKESADYGKYRQNPAVMRCKLNANANMINERTLNAQFQNSAFFGKYSSTDGKALFAISKGYDGWFSQWSGYNMILNRGALTSSSQSKTIRAKNGGYAGSWRTAQKTP